MRGRGEYAAHRFVYEQTKGPILEGLTIDHLCRVRCCVNPDHLEVVTIQENIQRGFAARRKLCEPKVVRAREVIVANPEKTNRAIADEIGADPSTVSRARLAHRVDQPGEGGLP